MKLNVAALTLTLDELFRLLPNATSGPAGIHLTSSVFSQHPKMADIISTSQPGGRLSFIFFPLEEVKHGHHRLHSKV
jgi:hypothetical protein